MIPPLHEHPMDPKKLKGRPSFPFETIAVAVSFSPKLEAILTEAKQVADTFKARLLVLHVGKHTPEKEAALMEVCANLGIDREVRIVWGTGDPVDTLLETCKRHMVDLLILAARRRENVFRYYLGSVPRGLSRRAKCSLLLLTEPKVSGTDFAKIVVDCVEHPKTPHTLDTALYVGERVGALELQAVREVDPAEPAMAPADGSTTGQRSKAKEQPATDAAGHLQVLTAHRPVGKLRVETAVLTGRPGFTIRKFAEEYRADLLVIHSPDGEYRLVDRIFTHDMEHILENLPCNMLIVHTRQADGS